jgi:hypothetical protein
VPTEFDLDKLRVRAPTIARRSQTLRPRIPGRFIKGPIPLVWITAAAMLPGRCLHVGVAIWYLAGLGRREVVELRPAFSDCSGSAGTPATARCYVSSRAGLST